MSQIGSMIMPKLNRCNRIWSLLIRWPVVEINTTTHKCKAILDLKRAHNFCKWTLSLSIRVSSHRSKSTKSINSCTEGTADLNHHQIVDRIRRAVSARYKCSTHHYLQLINSQDLKHLQLKTYSLLLNKCLIKVTLDLKLVTICPSRTVEAAALRIYLSRTLPSSLQNHNYNSRTRINQLDTTCQSPWYRIAKRTLLPPIKFNSNSSSLVEMMWT